MPVKVLGDNGSGTVADVIASIDRVTANADVPAVANLSLGGPANAALDAVVDMFAPGRRLLASIKDQLGGVPVANRLLCVG